MIQFLTKPLATFRGLRAFWRVAADPTRLDEVFVLADLAEESPELARFVEEARQNPAFARALEKRPRLGHVDMPALLGRPRGSLGHTFGAFLRDNGLEPEDILLVDGETDLDFVRNHLRETHDLWHVLTGFGTDVAGELGVQAFYLGQFRAPLAVMLLAAGLGNTLVRGMHDKDRRMTAICRGYLLGRRAEPLFGTEWARHWDEPLTAVRARLGLDFDVVDRLLPAVDEPITPELLAA